MTTIYDYQPLTPAEFHQAQIATASAIADLASALSLVSGYLLHTMKDPHFLSKLDEDGRDLIVELIEEANAKADRLSDEFVFIERRLQASAPQQASTPDP